MTDKKPKKEVFTTGIATVVMAYLDKPSTKFNPDGTWSVKVRLSAEEGAKLEAKLGPLYDKAIEEGKQKFSELPVAQRKKIGEFTADPLFTPVYNDQEEETGEVELSAKLDYKGKDKKTGDEYFTKPALFDASGTILKKRPRVGSGSKIKVAFTGSPYFTAATGTAGLSKYLKAAQIIDLIEYGVGSADSYGFGKEEGYEAGDDDVPFDTSDDNEVAETQAQEHTGAPKF